MSLADVLPFGALLGIIVGGAFVVSVGFAFLALWLSRRRAARHGLDVDIDTNDEVVSVIDIEGGQTAPTPKNRKRLSKVRMMNNGKAWRLTATSSKTSDDHRQHKPDGRSPLVSLWDSWWSSSDSETELPRHNSRRSKSRSRSSSRARSRSLSLKRNVSWIDEDALHGPTVRVGSRNPSRRKKSNRQSSWGAIKNKVPTLPALPTLPNLLHYYDGSRQKDEEQLMGYEYIPSAYGQLRVFTASKDLPEPPRSVIVVDRYSSMLRQKRIMRTNTNPASRIDNRPSTQHVNRSPERARQTPPTTPSRPRPVTRASTDSTLSEILKSTDQRLRGGSGLTPSTAASNRSPSKTSPNKKSKSSARRSSYNKVPPTRPVPKAPSRPTRPSRQVSMSPSVASDDGDGDTELLLANETEPFPVLDLTPSPTKSYNSHNASPTKAPQQRASAEQERQQHQQQQQRHLRPLSAISTGSGLSLSTIYSERYDAPEEGNASITTKLTATPPLNPMISNRNSGTPRSSVVFTSPLSDDPFTSSSSPSSSPSRYAGLARQPRPISSYTAPPTSSQPNTPTREHSPTKASAPKAAATRVEEEEKTPRPGNVSSDSISPIKRTPSHRSVITSASPSPKQIISSLNNSVLGPSTSDNSITGYAPSSPAATTTTTRAQRQVKPFYPPYPTSPLMKFQIMGGGGGGGGGLQHSNSTSSSIYSQDTRAAGMNAFTPHALIAPGVASMISQLRRMDSGLSNASSNTGASVSGSVSGNTVASESSDSSTIVTTNGRTVHPALGEMSGGSQRKYYSLTPRPISTATGMAEGGGRVVSGGRSVSGGHGGVRSVSGGGAMDSRTTLASSGKGGMGSASTSTLVASTLGSSVGISSMSISPKREKLGAPRGGSKLALEFYEDDDEAQEKPRADAQDYLQQKRAARRRNRAAAAADSGYESLHSWRGSSMREEEGGGEPRPQSLRSGVSGMTGVSGVSFKSGDTKLFTVKPIGGGTTPMKIRESELKEEGRRHARDGSNASSLYDADGFLKGSPQVGHSKSPARKELKKPKSAVHSKKMSEDFQAMCGVRVLSMGSVDAMI
ncbi:hypothetical protein QBC46DRAFT_436001 [Diplogelasinospora grovesii]|uniref:Uncharacterized protein n=1 Tax=Diplogelasinospora grovesii TaxID=303347 RepID=A0AAN6S998_9PEZI|nr:hypothetical protein QBC46DRAFT_436001 [Diplogelasinospora grovesii]